MWFSMATQLAIIVAQRQPRFEFLAFCARMGQNGQNGQKWRPVLVCHGDTHFLKFRLSAQRYPERTRGSPPTTRVGVRTPPIPIVEGRWSRLAEEYGSKTLIFRWFLHVTCVVGEIPKKIIVLAGTSFFFVFFSAFVTQACVLKPGAISMACVCGLI